ncbi:MAG: hypothetical protein OXI30_09695 [Chloroflexota bacterium]|nr:hypothetical protein [Chloroflexota bacterium]
MTLENVYRLLSNVGLVGEIKHDRVSNFRFIALSSRAAGASENVTVPARLPCIVYLHGTQCIVSIEVAGIIAINHDSAVVVQTILDWWDTYDQLREYPVYRAIDAIKQTGYAAFFENRNIYVYKLGDDERLLDFLEMERLIEQIGSFDKQNSCAVFELKENSWAYSSSVTDTSISNLSLEQCVEVFKENCLPARL